MISRASILDQLSYSPDDGLFTWVKTKRRDLIGATAGRLESRGYRQIYINDRRYMAHRLAWLCVNSVWPGPDDLDHINGNRDDNRICNLRVAKRFQNIANACLRKDNATGARGVYQLKDGRFLASIQLGGRREVLGRFQTLESAKIAYNEAAKVAFGEFVRCDP